jgi:Zn-dependent M28 family amino/carboxypeptidase
MRWLRTARSHLVLAVAPLVLTGCSDSTSPEVAATPSAIVVPRGRLEAHVQTLAHDSMCGRLVGTEYERQAATYIAEEFADAGLTPAGTDGYFQTVLAGPLPREAPAATELCAADPVATSQNVIGALAGQGALAGRWIVVSAHYDHLGWDASDGFANVFNGADDNASGTAVMLEVAHALAAWIAAHPEAAASYRSVMFHGYGAEEIGLFGSRHYVSAPTVPVESLYGVVNLDMVGRLRDRTLIVAGSSTAPGWIDLLATSRPNELTIVFDEGSLNRSDQWSFIGLAGVAGLHLFTGTHEDYHTTRDDPPLLNYEGMQMIARLTLGLVWEMMTGETALEGTGGT